MICICHDIESNVDTKVTESECREAFHRMLAVERAHDVRTTYQVLGLLFRDTAATVAADGLCAGLSFVRPQGWRPPRNWHAPARWTFR
ncbi:MAG: hypothetical protein IPL75_13600 [Acidobacteria bacterium]|nr:hypothetical protein [Acidobacteriota bacterium]